MSTDVVGSLVVFNFKNRFMSRAFAIKLKPGWFSGQVLITPEDAEQFVGGLWSTVSPVAVGG
ncbi:hypothetical protein [Lysobacter gummosus]|uniref:Uncharacterized protein n=1 Tax=Lysobacter gummosus TaxID=262324 RepID=A0ABY3X770_9GAMM|nr:hypothetical protein [Lysobacter gummosus]UNP28426.1 hypothetical protein MOV92_18265 [Lysobacter gummosus]